MGERRWTMPHPKGERLRCDDCGAEILFMKACPCPPHDPPKHSNLCCNKEMRSLGVDSSTNPGAKP
jgi:hypothetical protein